MEQPLVPLVMLELDSPLDPMSDPDNSDDVMMNQLQFSLDEDERIYRAEIDKANAEYKPSNESLHEIHLTYVTSMKYKLNSPQELFEFAQSSRREALLLYVISSRHKAIQKRQKINLATMLARKKIQVNSEIVTWHFK